MNKKALTITIVANMTSNYSESLGNIASVQKVFRNRKVYTIRSRESLKNAIMTQSGLYEDLKTEIDGAVQKKVTEAMTSAWVAYSNLAEDISRLPDAYKEAHTALEVGKIFYADKNVFGYNQLGIGRLIYQLPISICEMFIDEIFKEETLDSIDEETLITIRTFFENNLNLSETSRQLYVHRNTLVYRFEKLQRKFGLDIRAFEDALTFKLAMMVVDYIKYSKNHPS